MIKGMTENDLVILSRMTIGKPYEKCFVCGKKLFKGDGKHRYGDRAYCMKCNDEKVGRWVI